MISRYSIQLLVFLVFFTSMVTHAQVSPVAARITQNGQDLFGNNSVFIENVGQYGDTLAGYGYMGKIICAYEGFGMPVLFTKKGMIYLQRETKLRTIEEIQKEERRKKRKGEKPAKIFFRDKIVTMEWVQANSNLQWQFDIESPVTHSYGIITKKANGFQKLVLTNLYPGIDVEFLFNKDKRLGFEYQLMVHPGADPSLVKMKYGGDVTQVERDENGNMEIRSSIETISQSSPIAFSEKKSSENEVTVSFKTDKKTVCFRLPRSYDKTKLLIIDPFISSTSSFNGSNSPKAKDIDFDYAGNVYVSGGGNSGVQMLAKYSPNGVLLWTFTGSLSMPAWVFGGHYGGWVIEKTSGAAYLGQGLTSGFRIIRLNSNGVYDNYITTANSSFAENWKMIYSCRGGSGTILAAGGGGNANNELALISPPNLVPVVSNISGLTGGHNDISDIVLDPLTDDMYTIFSIPASTTAGDNIIYKHVPPFGVANRAWSTPTGLMALREPANRPYMQGLDNSSNTLALNANYLFYWDGQNLKAFHKSGGVPVGNVLRMWGAKLFQGGIYADECNNVFVGNDAGTIKVFRFNGTDFVDSLAADLNVTGFSTFVYDLAYDNGRKLLYASGDGFVASFDIAAYCPAQVYEVRVQTSCNSSNVTTTITPAPSAGTTINYVLYSGSTTITSNSTGTFTGLAQGSYTITAFLNQACGGPNASVNFEITGTPTLVVNNPPISCQPLTTDLTSPAITAGSSAGLTFTYWSNAAATIPYTTPAVATAGTYYIKASNANGCFIISAVNVTSAPSPVANAGTDKTVCQKTDVQLQGSGGLTYQWSPTTYLNNPSIANPVVVQAPPGTYLYQLTVTNAAGCTSVVSDQIRVIVQTQAALYLPSDTAIVINQPLQLNPIDVHGMGLINFVWSPSFGLNDAFIQNPVAIIDRSMTYTVTANTAGNCPAMAKINVTVFKQPDIFVPSAFTPNNNGLNDVLRARPMGIKTFNYFRVFDRSGMLVFSTSDPQRGWDGKIQGVPQGSGVFVWLAEGVDYSGNIVFRKGTTTIIR